MSNKGVLYIVATPIGNLDDISQRALNTLKSADVIAAEDTRHSTRLLQHFGINTRLIAYHDHGAEKQGERILTHLQQGESVALISDAGTPLISDPGYRIVKDARALALQVVPIPGASAPITALSAAGLPTDRFSFEGFLPAKSSGRKKIFDALLSEVRTMVFFESPHRIVDSLRDAVAVFGEERSAVMGRELTKTFETFIGETLGQILAKVELDTNQRKGEIVLMISGKVEDPDAKSVLSPEAEQTLVILLDELPTKQAAALASKLTGYAKKLFYQRAIELKADS